MQTSDLLPGFPYPMPHPYNFDTGDPSLDDTLKDILQSLEEKQEERKANEKRKEVAKGSTNGFTTQPLTTAFASGWRKLPVELKVMVLTSIIPRDCTLDGEILSESARRRQFRIPSDTINVQHLWCIITAPDFAAIALSMLLENNRICVALAAPKYEYPKPSIMQHIVHLSIAIEANTNVDWEHLEAYTEPSSLGLHSLQTLDLVFVAPAAIAPLDFEAVDDHLDAFFMGLDPHVHVFCCAVTAHFQSREALVFRSKLRISCVDFGRPKQHAHVMKLLNSVLMCREGEPSIPTDSGDLSQRLDMVEWLYLNFDI